MPQVVAGVVFAQAAQTLPYMALRGHHFQAQAQIARIAVAQYLCATRVAGQVATQGATAFRRQTQCKQKTGFVSGLLYVLKNATCFCGEGGVGRVYVAHLVHALQIDDHFAPRGIGCGAHHQTGVAALRHHGCADRRTDFHHGRHFGGGARSHHAQRSPVFAAAPVALISRQAFTGQHIGLAGDLLECFY